MAVLSCACVQHIVAALCEHAAVTLRHSSKTKPFKHVRFAKLQTFESYLPSVVTHCSPCLSVDTIADQASDFAQMLLYLQYGLSPTTDPVFQLYL